jgi:ATP-dependent Lon protease
MATAIVSLISGRPVSDKVGMTGEITLTGQVLPIGGVREKALAAQRAGLRTVVIPRENEPDLEELPEETRSALSFVLADSIGQVLDTALNGGRAPRARAPAARARQAAARVG